MFLREKMKAILEFNIPEDEVEYNIANKAKDLALVVWEFHQHMRSQIKYHGKDYEELWKEFNDICGERGVDIYSLLP